MIDIFLDKIEQRRALFSTTWEMVPGQSYWQIMPPGSFTAANVRRIFILSISPTTIEDDLYSE